MSKVKNFFIVFFVVFFVVTCSLLGLIEIPVTPLTEEEISSQYKALTEIILSDKSDEEILSFLKTNKISKQAINQKDKNGYSALYLAIDKRRAGVVNKLISKGADKNQITDITIRDKTGRKILRCSPVLYAAWRGDVECLHKLMNKNADTQIESDFIIPTTPEPTYIRLLCPVDAAFYNRRSIKFSAVYNQLKEDKLDLEHSHFSGTPSDLSEVKTIELLKKYDLLEEL